MCTHYLTFYPLYLTTMIAVFTSAIIKEARGLWMVINSDFPDPSFVQSTDRIWYAFGSNSNSKHV
jgi:hypothetical protein